MITTVGELLELLEDFDPEAPVALAIQPSYPFKHSLGQAVLAADGTVYLAEGGQQGYLEGTAREELGW